MSEFAPALPESSGWMAERAAPREGRPTWMGWNTFLDGAERLLVLGLYGYLGWRLVPREGGPWLGNFLLLVSEGLVLVLFVIRRPATAISPRRSDWLLALGGTLLPMCVDPTGRPVSLVTPIAYVLLMVCGVIVQIHAKLALGRSMGMVAADRGIKRGGPYQFLRHPMYAGYVLTHVGFGLLHPSGWNWAVYAGALAVQINRLLAEERFLSQNPDYREYMDRVHFRLIPRIF